MLFFYSRNVISQKILILLLLFILSNNAIKRQSINKQLSFRKKLSKINRTKAITRKILILFSIRDKRKHKCYSILITYTQLILSYI